MPGGACRDLRVAAGKGLGKGAVEHSGNAVCPHFHMRFAPMEIWKTACLGYEWHCGFGVLLRVASAAHADTSMLQGARVVGLGKKMLSG